MSKKISKAEFTKGMDRTMASMVDMDVVGWIWAHLGVTHNDLPIEYAREWLKRGVYSEPAYGYIVFGYMQRNKVNLFVEPDAVELLDDFLVEFSAKLLLILYQEAAGVKVTGIPLFQIVGQERLAAALRPAGAPARVLSLVGKR